MTRLFKGEKILNLVMSSDQTGQTPLISGRIILKNTLQTTIIWLQNLNIYLSRLISRCQLANLLNWWLICWADSQPYKPAGLLCSLFILHFATWFSKRLSRFPVSQSITQYLYIFRPKFSSKKVAICHACSSLAARVRAILFRKYGTTFHTCDSL